MGVSKYFNVENPPKLLEDLKEDPFINHALTSVYCELYYKYGMYLAPFTAMLTTAKHINFNKNKNAIEKMNQEAQKTQEPQSEEPQIEGPQKREEPPQKEKNKNVSRLVKKALTPDGNKNCKPSKPWKPWKLNSQSK